MTSEQFDTLVRLMHDVARYEAQLDSTGSASTRQLEMDVEVARLTLVDEPK